MRKLSLPIAIIAISLLAISCKEQQETTMFQEISQTSNSRPSGEKVTAPPIGNGSAYGIPLQTGINFRLINVVNVSTIQKIGAILQDWWPNPKATFEKNFSKTATYMTNSEITYSSSLGISASAMQGLVTANVGAAASKTASKSIATTLSTNVSVPAFKQFQWRVLEKRIGWNGTVVKITVIGNPLTASIDKGTIKVEYSTTTGSYPSEIFEDKIFR